MGRKRRQRVARRNRQRRVTVNVTMQAPPNQGRRDFLMLLGTWGGGIAAAWFTVFFQNRPELALAPKPKSYTLTAEGGHYEVKGMPVTLRVADSGHAVESVTIEKS